jgi:hypothetical protein
MPKQRPTKMPNKGLYQNEKGKAHTTANADATLTPMPKSNYNQNAKTNANTNA